MGSEQGVRNREEKPAIILTRSAWVIRSAVILVNDVSLPFKDS